MGKAQILAALALCCLRAPADAQACLVMHSLQNSYRMQAQNEVAVLALLDHPNVVKYYECFAEQGTRVKIVMELCEARSAPSCVPAHPQLALC